MSNLFLVFFLKVHPSSLNIEGTLGNLRLRDMSLGTDNFWGWLCDIRNPGVESLIKVHYPLFDEKLMHCRFHFVFFFYVYIPFNCVGHLFFSLSFLVPIQILLC